MSRFLLMLWCAGAMAQTLVIRTSTVIDGKGHVLRGQEIVLEGGRIARIADAKQKPDIDLTGMTVMPGWIDTHVHLGWTSTRESSGPGAGGIEETPHQDALYCGATRTGRCAADSRPCRDSGEEIEGDLREINAGVIPGRGF